MAALWLFFRPARLPLESDGLDADTVLPLNDATAVKAALEHVFPGIEWSDDGEGRAECAGRWLEFRLGEGDDTLSLRVSLRADYRDIVQRLCDDCGWLAFDDTPLCYQPHRPPMPA